MPKKRYARSAIFAAVLLALSSGASRAGNASAVPRVAPPAGPVVAQLGIELPALGGRDWWSVVRKQYFTPEIIADIRDNLHADYVRTGWVPGWLHFETIRWHREDSGMDLICGSGLHAMIILPGPPKGEYVESDLVTNVREFFARYTKRDPGCIRYAEAANEADLPVNRFAGVQAYAAYYHDVAPVVASFGVPIITSGVSGENRDWTSELANLLYASKTPVSGYGFHPYGVEPARMAEATLAMRRAAGALADGNFPVVYVTEIGESNARALYDTIVNLSHVTPTITIYEYQAQGREDPRYGLKNNPALYAAVQRAWATLHAQPANSSTQQ